MNTDWMGSDRTKEGSFFQKDVEGRHNLNALANDVLFLFPN